MKALGRVAPPGYRLASHLCFDTCTGCNMLVTSPGTAPRTSARARYGRRHPGSKGPSKEFIFFFFKRNGPHSYDFVLGPTTIAVVLEAKPIGIITRVVAMEGNPLETEAASCRIRVQLFESTCKRKSILHRFFIQQHRPCLDCFKVPSFFTLSPSHRI